MKASDQAEAVAEAGEAVPFCQCFGDPGCDLEVFGLLAEQFTPELDHVIPVGELGLALPDLALGSVILGSTHSLSWSYSVS